MDVVLCFCVVFFCLCVILITLPTSMTLASCGEFGWVLGNSRVGVQARRSASPVVVCVDGVKADLHFRRSCARLGFLAERLLAPTRTSKRSRTSPTTCPADYRHLLLRAGTPTARLADRVSGWHVLDLVAWALLEFGSMRDTQVGTFVLSPVCPRALGIWIITSKFKLGICPDNNDQC